ncbi:MAG: hypothetical protein JW774_08110, partial [Candidatus Aureabacteria bacterium]|nr:hypothetical protein [Candidatus Auribacterota bacterium]
GQLPFEEGDFVKRLTVPPIAIQNVAAELNSLLAALIMKCIQTESNGRFKNFEQIRAVLVKTSLSN